MIAMEDVTKQTFKSLTITLPKFNDVKAPEQLP